eukprot:COSAG02_NODE_7505_length_2982_cov_2.082206_3_plen_219_part_00
MAAWAACAFGWLRWLWEGLGEGGRGVGRGVGAGSALRFCFNATGRASEWVRRERAGGGSGGGREGEEGVACAHVKMLARLYKEHQEKQVVIKAQNDARRREVLNAVPRVTDALVTSVNQNVSDIFFNQRYIEREVRNLQAQTERFTKQTQQWLACIDGFNNNMKELGDFESYAANIEGDMRTIATAIQMITQRSRQPPQAPPGGPAGSPNSGSPRLLV